MPNTKSLASFPKLKILLWSASGTGKTTLVGTMREFGEMYFFDTDLRMNVLAGLDIDYDSYFDLNPSSPTGYKAIMRKLDELHKVNKYSTIVIDGLTTLVPIVMNEALHAVNSAMTLKRVANFVPALPDYNSFNHHMNRLMSKFCSLPCHTVMTGHEVTDKDELSQRVFKNIACPGKPGDLLPGYFNEVWRMEIVDEAVPDQKGLYKQAFKVRTRPTTTCSARTSYPNALNTLEPANVPAMYAKINKWLQEEHSQALADINLQALKNQSAVPPK